MANPVTPELVMAYWFCQRKAFLLLRGDRADAVHDYVKVTAQEATRVFENYYDSCKRGGLAIVKGGHNISISNRNDDIISAAALTIDGFKAKADFLIRPANYAYLPLYYEPYLAIGTHIVSDAHKIHLAATGYILTKLLGVQVLSGGVVNADAKTVRIKLTSFLRVIEPIIEKLSDWTRQLPASAPPVVLKDHCHLCMFKRSCTIQAELEDNLSLLDRMTPTIMSKYNKRGVFSVKQLSYLYRPRRKSKNVARPALRFDFALQSLAICNQKIYVHELPSIGTQSECIFCDVEGIPDQDLIYLVGLLVCTVDTTERYSFWADSKSDERTIFNSFLRVVEKYPRVPIYHYGSYELKYIKQLSKK